MGPLKKKYILRALLLLSFTNTSLHADFEDSIVSQEEIETPEHQGPFRGEFSFDAVGSANIDKPGFTGQEVDFSCFAGRVGSVICYSKVRREAFMLAIGGARAKIDWEENPYFSQTVFPTATLALRFFSNRLEDWIWQAQFAMNIDTEHWDFNHYLNFDILLWGRHDWRPNIGLHAGFIVQTGMQIDRIYPIIGFDWKINDLWKLNLVFPVNLSIERTLNDCWKAALAVRFFDVRERADEDEPLPMALVCYRNTGLELAFKYDWANIIEANIHAGYTVGGELRISNRHNDHPKHFDLGSAGYIGSELVVKY